MDARNTVIRNALGTDLDRMMFVAQAIGLFGPSELSFLRDSITNALSRSDESEQLWIVNEENGDILALAFYAPEKMTDGTWNVYLIAVQPSHQQQGRGSAMLRFIESDLMRRNQRILLIETSALPEFSGSRTFYLKNGYEEEGRVRDFYKEGEDKVIFRKRVDGARFSRKAGE